VTGVYDFFYPFIQYLEPEMAHKIAIKALKYGFISKPSYECDPSLAVNVFGIKFQNPLGLAAGFDKDAEVPDAMLEQGFGFVEVGSVTPLAQRGNPRPRLFRLLKDRSLINRMGFNNRGVEAALRRLQSRRTTNGIIGVNLGKNKLSMDPLSDYAHSIGILAPYSSYIVINISSPNTPRLRELQGAEKLSKLLKELRRILDDIANIKKPPLLLKISPDINSEERVDIASAVMTENIDGIIATNTTITRPITLQDIKSKEEGGLSGAALFDCSTHVLADMYKLTEGKIPLIGVGGITNAKTAYAKIRAGASLVQLYSVMVYEGPGIIIKILEDLAALLKADGYTSLNEAIGADVKV